MGLFDSEPDCTEEEPGDDDVDSGLARFQTVVTIKM